MDIGPLPIWDMELSFDCECGEKVSDFTRGEGGEVAGIKLVCPSCEALYVATITQLREGTKQA